MSPQAAGKKPRRKAHSRRKNEPHFHREVELHRLWGVDLTRIEGIEGVTAQVILSELGTDLSAFPHEGAFSSWCFRLVGAATRYHGRQSHPAEVAREQEPSSQCAADGGGISLAQRLLSRRSTLAGTNGR